MPTKMATMDGNEASPIAEEVDEWSAHGKLNIFGQPVKVVEIESEAGTVSCKFLGLGSDGAVSSGLLTSRAYFFT